MSDSQCFNRRMKSWHLVLVTLLWGCGSAQESATDIPVGAYGTSTYSDTGAPDDALDEADGGERWSGDALMLVKASRDQRQTPRLLMFSLSALTMLRRAWTPRHSARTPLSYRSRRVRTSLSPHPSLRMCLQGHRASRGALWACAPEFQAVDTDGDGLSDCDELSDLSEATDPTRFNGLSATIGVP